MKYHFIGDQGVSMKGLKQYMSLLGNQVSGSDLKSGGHRAENITDDIDVVVRTSAVTPGSPGWVEVEEAQKRGIKVIKRSKLIEEISKEKKVIAVSGMHGKTTITAMVGLLLVRAGMDPTIFVGDDVKELDGVFRKGNSEWFVVESCEYDRSFLDLKPNILLLSNIEEEHLDTYPGGLPEIMEAFIEAIKNVDQNGVIIACADDKNVKEAIKRSGAETKIIYYGFLSERYNKLDFKLAIPGKHNIQNALSVVALADHLGIDQDIVKLILTQFSGAHRRFELIGNYKGADIIDDYGHHPTEIEMTISALKERYPDKEKIVLFWPHQYKRIKPLLSKFSKAFNGADKVILKPIFFVPGRDEMLDIDSKDLAIEINKNGEKAIVIEDDADIVKHLEKELNEKTVLLTIGIPPVYKIANKLLGKDGGRR